MSRGKPLSIAFISLTMEYQVSARKYRPQTFASVVGQEALTTTLRNAVMSGKLAHAFLFCGPRGVGKTTCARIFARTINCEHPTAEGEACGECESCKAFNEQRSYNVFELDAASNNSVENIKQLMEQTRIPPQVGRYKVFIIDEVHMLSTQAFNAFLKTLEEPPAYVIFILATTEKNKLLPTIISRCQIYDFDRMTVPNTVNHLKQVAEKEGYTYEEEALEIIAEKADGGMRDALSIFDQAASFCQGNITVEKVVKDLNLMDVENYFDIVDMSLKNQVKDVMLKLNDMLSNGMDGNNIVNGLATHIRNVMMAKDPQTIPLLDASQRYSQRYEEQAKACPVAFLYRALQILNRCDLNYRQSTNKRLLVELTLIEVAQITQPADADASGPRKGKRLKSLFKLLATQPTKPAVQVAGAVTTSTGSAQATAAVDNAAMPAPKDTASITSATPPPSAASAPATSDASTAPSTPSAPDSGAPASGEKRVVRPKFKLSAMGNSFANLTKEAANISTDEHDINPDTVDDNKFDVAMLQREWLAMCLRMLKTKEYVGLASSMRNLRPEIGEYPNITLKVGNSILLEQLMAIRKRIQVTLANNLKNANLKLDISLAEGTTIKRVPNKKEMFDKMKEERPVFKNLVDALALELV